MPYIEDINRQYIYSFLHFIITDKTSQQILSPKSLITPLPLGRGWGGGFVSLSERGWG